jgi:hypothetical protein
MDVEMLRMVERIIVSLGGILSVYLGYRLFIVASVKTDSGGSFKSALFSASLTKVGPGVFFALFGAYVMATSITTQINVQTEQPSQAAVHQSAYAHALLSQMGSVVAGLPDSAEKTRLVGLIRQAYQDTTPAGQPSGPTFTRRSMQID